MNNVFGRPSARRKKGEPLTSTIFHGIQQAVDEIKLSIKDHCYTPRSVNTVIEGGNIKVRHNYERVITSITTDMADGYTYVVKSMHVYSPNTGEAYLLAGVQAKSGSPLAHHHYCLLHRKLDLSNGWAEVKAAAVHALGSAGSSVWFSNADFTFANYSGDFNETATTTFASILVNGNDPPMFYTPSGIGILGSSGWYDATVNATTNTFQTSSAVVSLNDTVEFYSKEQSIPGGISAWKAYYAVDISGSSFKVSNTYSGTAIDITSIGAGVVVRVVKDYGAWVTVTVNKDTAVITAASLATNGKQIMFQAPNGSLPRGLLSTRLYEVLNVSGSTFQVCAIENGIATGVPLTVTSAGSNVQARSVKSNPKDAPRGSNVFIHNNRIWIVDGYSAYHNAGYYDDPKTQYFDGKAHPNDWTTALSSGSFPLQTWDGDVIRVARNVNGQPWIAKENTAWLVTGDEPPYKINQMFAAKGTIAPNSLCGHGSGMVFYATREGIQLYSNYNTTSYLTDEIRDIWDADNEDCIAVVVGDTLLVHGNFNHPVTGTSGKGVLAVDIPSKNINYWTLAAGASTLTVGAVLAPNFTTLATNVVQPEFWFASGDEIWRYDPDEPAEGAAEPMEYYEPAHDYGSAMDKKRVARLSVAGDGGTLTITPIVDGVAKTAKTVELPETNPISVSSANGRRIAFKYSSTDDPVVIKKIERAYQ